MLFCKEPYSKQQFLASQSNFYQECFRYFLIYECFTGQVDYQIYTTVLIFFAVQKHCYWNYPGFINKDQSIEINQLGFTYSYIYLSINTTELSLNFRQFSEFLKILLWLMHHLLDALTMLLHMLLVFLLHLYRCLVLLYQRRQTNILLITLKTPANICFQGHFIAFIY